MKADDVIERVKNDLSRINRVERGPFIIEDVEALLREIELLRAAVDYNSEPDDAERGPDHPIFKMAEENDHLRGKYSGMKNELWGRIEEQNRKIDELEEALESERLKK